MSRACRSTSFPRVWGSLKCIWNLASKFQKLQILNFSKISIKNFSKIFPKSYTLGVYIRRIYYSYNYPYKIAAIQPLSVRRRPARSQRIYFDRTPRSPGPSTPTASKFEIHSKFRYNINIKKREKETIQKALSHHPYNWRTHRALILCINRAKRKLEKS